MKTVGTVQSLWRYPVKGMRGEEVPQAFIGFAGVYGDRCYAFKNSAARVGFPYLSAPGQPAMLRYQPRFRYPERSVAPPNLVEAQAIAPGVTPVNAGPNDLDLDVITPSGVELSLDDPALLGMLVEGLRGENQLSLVRSDRALTDCRPLSLIALQTMEQVGKELGLALDKRRFRANIYLDLADGAGFGENELVGKKLSLGAKAQVMVLERDPRCKAISLDPETGEHDPNIFRSVAQLHGADAGVYCAVLVEGMAKTGDSIQILE
jgi:uncharacterized protein YcbX